MGNSTSTTETSSSIQASGPLPTGSNAVIDTICRFLASIGLPPIIGPLPPDTLLPGVTIIGGRLAVDPEQVRWPGDLLHEAGHIAVTPAALRARLDGSDLADDVAEHAGEAEATAWAYAATRAIGLDPAVLFHPGGYHGKGQRLAFTYAAGCYPGAAGLITGGLALSAAAARDSGMQAYPHMQRWLRE
jgi:hypothetical protein